MERSLGDGSGGSGTGSALVPATGSVIPTGGAPAANPAGTNPTPMTVDDGFFLRTSSGVLSVCAGQFHLHQ